MSSHPVKCSVMTLGMMLSVTQLGPLTHSAADSKYVPYFLTRFFEYVHKFSVFSVQYSDLTGEHWHFFRCGHVPWWSPSHPPKLRVYISLWLHLSVCQLRADETLIWLTVGIFTALNPCVIKAHLVFVAHVYSHREMSKERTRLV